MSKRFSTPADIEKHNAQQKKTRTNKLNRMYKNPENAPRILVFIADDAKGFECKMKLKCGCPRLVPGSKISIIGDGISKKWMHNTCVLGVNNLLESDQDVAEPIINEDYKPSPFVNSSVLCFRQYSIAQKKGDGWYTPDPNQAIALQLIEEWKAMCISRNGEY